MKKSAVMMLSSVVFMFVVYMPALNAASPANWCGTAVLNEKARNVDWAALRSRHKAMKRSPMEYNVGDTRIFWTWDLSVMPPGYNQTTATCRAKGDYCYIWVADAQWQNPITQEDVDTVFDAWEVRSPDASVDPTKGIYQIATGIFGPVPDEFDNDVRVNILYYDVGSFHGSTFDGFFREFDEMTEEEAQAYGEHSNESEILYLNSKGTVPPGDPYMLGVLAHEFQHMIHWLADSDEATWVNEGCSQLSWYFCGYGTDGQEAIFAGHPNNDLTKWEENGDYGQVTMFFVYLCEQFGGTECATRIVANKENGFDGITAAISGMGYHFEPSQVVTDWIVANYVNDTSLGHGQYGYFQFDAPSFRVASTVDAYPATDVTGNLKDWSGRYIELKNGTTQLNVHLTQAGNDFRGLVYVPASKDSGRICPLDPGVNMAQIPDFSSAILILANRNSSGNTASYSFSATDTAESDTTPPYVYSVSAWGNDVQESSAEISARDELGSIDVDAAMLTLNGNATPLDIVSNSDGSVTFSFSFADYFPDQDVHGVVSLEDATGNAMTNYDFYFHTGDTAMPTWTPNPITPTPTATPETTLGVTLDMPSHTVYPGDPCYLDARIHNYTSESYTNIPLFVILEAYGEYFFAPSWKSLEDGLDYYSVDVNYGTSVLHVLNTFTWPDISGSGAVVFYGAMTNAGITELLGTFSAWDFEWRSR